MGVRVAADPPNEVCVVWDQEMHWMMGQGWTYLGRYTKPPVGSPREDFVRWVEMRDYVWLVR